MSWRAGMENTAWLRQSKGKPLFPDVLWSRPENKRHAGKLLIIGGHQQSFSAVSEAYAAAAKAGAGTIRVILPDKLQKMLSKVFPEAEFAASTPIGSFGRAALDKLLESAEWADAVLLAGEFGRNSETAILLESFAEKYSGQLALAGDAIDYFLNQPDKITKRSKNLIVASLSQLQKLAAPSLIQQNADFIKIIEQLSVWSAGIDAGVVTIHSEKAIAAFKQRLSSTPVKISTPDINLASYAAVWLMQQPEKSFEALTSAVYCYSL